MKIITLICFAFLLAACDKGITPESEIQEAGFSGTITFSGTWPDSVQRTHLVVFRDPLLLPSDFNIFNLSFVGEGIPPGAEIFTYNSNDTSIIAIAPGTYSYAAVAQSKTLEFSPNRSDWYVIGVYYADNDTITPGKLIIPENTLIRNIDIICDFNNPPPQPPGG